MNNLSVSILFLRCQRSSPDLAIFVFSRSHQIKHKQGKHPYNQGRFGPHIAARFLCIIFYGVKYGLFACHLWLSIYHHKLVTAKVVPLVLLRWRGRADGEWVLSSQLEARFFDSRSKRASHANALAPRLFEASPEKLSSARSTQRIRITFRPDPGSRERAIAASAWRGRRMERRPERAEAVRREA